MSASPTPSTPPVSEAPADTAPRADATSSAWAGPEDALQEAVCGIFDVVSGRLPDERATDYIHPDVQVAIGNLVAKGISYWFGWLHLGRKTCGLKNLGLEAVRMTTEDQSVRIDARFSGTRPDGSVQKSDPVTFRHRVKDGRIVRMETVWPNYGFMFGKLSTVLFLRPVLIIRIWTHHLRYLRQR